MEPYDWDERIDYLQTSRYNLMNDDYIEFLIRQVWGWKEPIHLADYGCGLGNMGMKFLPHLPKGSRYTGLDKGEKLIRHARESFRSLPYQADFIQCDLNEGDVEEARYDAAVCQALLLHMSNPKQILAKMVRSVKPGGLVIGIEPHWIASMANMYVHELPQSAIIQLGILQKLYERDGDRTGKDGNIGIKLPVYMRELGLNNIGCRVSDCVRFLHPGREDQAELHQVLCGDGFAAPVQDEERFTAGLLRRGLSAEEAGRQLEAEKLLHERYAEHGLQYHIVSAPSMMITYGTKG